MGYLRVQGVHNGRISDQDGPQFSPSQVGLAPPRARVPRRPPAAPVDKLWISPSYPQVIHKLSTGLRTGYAQHLSTGYTQAHACTFGQARGTAGATCGQGCTGRGRQGHTQGHARARAGTRTGNRMGGYWWATGVGGRSAGSVQYSHLRSATDAVSFALLHHITDI